MFYKNRYLLLLVMFLTSCLIGLCGALIYWNAANTIYYNKNGLFWYMSYIQPVPSQSDILHVCIHIFIIEFLSLCYGWTMVILGGLAFEAIMYSIIK